MKSQIIITFSILSLFALVVPSANADTESTTSTTTMEELAPSHRAYTSMTVESAPITEVSDTPIYIESLKTDNIIEKDKHHLLISGVKHGKWL